MKFIGYDSETLPIQEGLAAPPFVCGSFAWETSDGDIDYILHRGACALDVLEADLRDPEVIIVGHNIAFDAAVSCAARDSLIPIWFAKYEAGLVRDTLLREELLDIKSGRMQRNGSTMILAPGGEWKRADYSLAGLVLKYMQKDRSAQKKGPDSWRLRYGELADVPVASWPGEARDYAIEDAIDTLKVFKLQQVAAGTYVTDETALVNEREQVYAAFCLQLISCWGMRTDKAAVDELERVVDIEYKSLQQKMLGEGLFKIKRCSAEEVREGKIDFWAPGTFRNKPVESQAFRYSKDMTAIRERVVKAFEAKGEPVPYSDPSDKFPEGQISTDSDTLELSGDELLAELGDRGKVSTIRNTFLPTLKQGIELPINCRFQPLLNTGRISSYKPNMNNLPRSGLDGIEGSDVRACIVPRPGFVFASVDYDVAELRSHSQILLWLFGKSSQAEFFQTTPDGDPHLELAASILNITPEEARKRKKEGDPEIKNMRQASKPTNFGLPGGLGWRTLKSTARKSYGVIFTDEEAQAQVRHWKGRWGEMQWYLDHISKRTGFGECDIEQLRYEDGKKVPHRIRGGCGYSDGANTYFQGLTADAFKHALTSVSKECYVDCGTALFGSRVLVALYDELIIECPADQAHEAAHRLAEVMCSAAQKWLPDIPVRASPALCTRWYKSAEAKYDESGRLVPWK